MNTPLGAVGTRRGLSTCRCCAPGPLSRSSSGRTLNSRDGSSPGRTTSVPLKQQSACTPDHAPACGTYSESPLRVPTAPNGSYRGYSSNHVLRIWDLGLRSEI